MVHGRDPHERGGGDARRQPEHAALLGAALRLPRAAAHRRRPPAVRPRRDRGAARRLRGDPERLVGDHARPRARRRPGQPVAPARRARSASTRARPTASWRRASPCARSSAASRRCSSPGSPRSTTGSAEAAFAWRWATGWLAAAKRVAPPATREEAVVVFDASAPGDVDGLHAQALELALRRRGLRTLTLGATLDHVRLARALHAVGPRVVVLTGRHASLDALARLVYTRAPRRARPVAVFDYRGALPRDGREHRRAPRRQAAGRGRAHRRGRRRPPGRAPPHAARREHLTHRVRPLRDDRPRR